MIYYITLRHLQRVAQGLPTIQVLDNTSRPQGRSKTDWGVAMGATADHPNLAPTIDRPTSDVT